MATRIKKYPNTRKGWADYYTTRFNKDPSNRHAEVLAIWHLFLLEAFGEYPGKG